ncbi:MAG: diguanylate cyclase, partial [Steroidobacteraceae bacterium]|nr:diguanylate cyclase [Steroidobacteraceae bacterium]MDW8260605.1 diguanylate cyclase [Gammaproteobacteria bacterium]
MASTAGKGQYRVASVTGLSSNTRLAVAVLGIVAAVLLACGAIAVWQARDGFAALEQTALQSARVEVQRELAARAQDLARHVAGAAADPLNRQDRQALVAALRSFVDDPTLVELTITDAGERVAYAWSRPNSGGAPADATPPRAKALSQITAFYQPFPDTELPRTVGTVQLEIEQTGIGPDSVAQSLAGVARQHMQRLLLVLAAAGTVLLLLSGGLAWWLTRRLREPLTALVRSVERIGQGDYSRPIAVQADSEFAELQDALERTRQRLRHTTITRNYLVSVLSGINDAVFVTSPEGVIKMANLAACRMLGYGEDELVGKSIVAVLDDAERPNFDLRQAAHDSRETVLRTRQRQTIPALLTGAPISSEDPQFQGIIFVARNITDRKRAERRIRYLARYDTLTKVPNRMQFQHLLQQAIARALRGGDTVALLYLDVDRFKDINDTFGHSAGDRTLEILAERLTVTLPKDAIVGRLAGDEFAIFYDGLAGQGDHRGPIAHLARSILNDIAKPLKVNQNEVYLTASIGIAFAPQDAENVIDLIRNADAAMYHSKQNGGNTFAFYQTEMNAAAVERLMLKSKLRRALEREELVVRYEPKVDIRTGRIIGAEALLRWRLPGHGDISPSQFIPLAEETNLILEIGEWVLDRVCSDYRLMQNEVANPGRISLNLSLKQLRQANFITRCRAVFRKHNVSPTAF